MDDEYAEVGTYDPRILITTCRNPSTRLLRFLKEMKWVFPNSTRTNRGNYLLPDLVKLAIKFEFTDLVIFHEHRGKPDGMIVCHLPSGPTAYFALSNVILRHDLAELPDNMSLEYPHLVFQGFNSQLGDRVSDILKFLFPVSKMESKRVISFVNKDDFIVFRHHTYAKEAYNKVELTEVGPRFIAKLFKVVLGTVDLADAETEWVLRPYMNSSKKRKFL
jgi:U3 small nucleolar ribonucleoprotein protein IMP4